MKTPLFFLLFLGFCMQSNFTSPTLSAQSSEDLVVVLEKSLKNQTVEAYFKQARFIHILDNGAVPKRANSDLKKAGIRVSSKIGLATRLIKKAVIVEVFVLKPKKAKVIYTIDGQKFKYILKNKEGWEVKKGGG